jgi:heat shock protein HslJ
MKNDCIVKAVLVFVLSLAGPSCTPEKHIHPPTLQDASKTLYREIFNDPVQLTEGRYEGEPFAKGGASRPTLQLIGDIFVTGSLDGDDGDEAVVLLAENSGGSGSFLYLAVLARRGSGVENIGTCPVGDRVGVRALKIAGSRIILESVQHGPGDAMCCPTQKTRRTWILGEEGLVEKENEVMGKISTADLAGASWVLRKFDLDESAPPDPPVTLIIEDGRILGSSGCNRYLADISEPSPGTVAIGTIGMTKMSCPDRIMSLENRYIDMLGRAERYGFLAGRLALTCRTGDGISTMLFEAVEQAAHGE